MSFMIPFVELAYLYELQENVNSLSHNNILVCFHIQMFLLITLTITSEMGG